MDPHGLSAALAPELSDGVRLATGCALHTTVYAAAHVVVDPLATIDPWDAAPTIDWDSTLPFREHLWSLGFKIAEAMDTAQRAMGVDGRLRTSSSAVRLSLIG